MHWDDEIVPEFNKVPRGRGIKREPFDPANKAKWKITSPAKQGIAGRAMNVVKSGGGAATIGGLLMEKAVAPIGGRQTIPPGGPTAADRRQMCFRQVLQKVLGVAATMMADADQSDSKR